MSKNGDTSELGHAKLENRVLDDAQLDAVSGGRGAEQYRGRYQLQCEQAHELLK
jgi:hypothetical protein